MKKTALFTSVLCLTQGSLLADVPLFINYQGKVYDSTGLPLGATGSASAPVAAPVNRKVLFRFYDAVTGGNRLWTEEQTVTIAVGEFSVLLGQGIAATGTAAGESRPAIDAVFTSGSASRYLEITVDNGDNSITAADVPITPRQQITTTAYSFRARTADSIAGSSDLAITPLTGTSTNYGIGWYGTGRLFNGVAVDGPVLYGNAGGALGSNTNGTYNTALRWNAVGQVGVGSATLAGAAASSKLVLQGDDASTPAQQLVIRGDSDTNKRLLFGFDTTLNQASLQSYSTSTLGAGLVLNPQGGNVGIGTAAPATGPKLNIADGAINNSRFASMQIVTAATGASYPQLALVRNGWHAAGLGHKLDSNVFGFGNTVATFDPNFLAINPDGGKVGIGTSNPITKFHVNGGDLRVDSSSNPSISLAAGASVAELAKITTAGAYSTSAAVGDTVLRTSAGGLHLQSGTAAAGLTVSSANNVGIGNTSPLGKFTVNSGNSAFTIGSGDPATGAWLRNDGQSTVFSSNVGDMWFGYGGVAKNLHFLGGGTTDDMVILSSGNVQIGTGTTTGRLNIGTTLATYMRYGGLSSDGGSSTNNQRTNNPVSIWADGTVVTTLVDISSDSRIKNILHPTDSAKDLQALMAIQITDYQFKDKVANGGAPQKKVIAQQVEQIFPQAVSVRKGVVPDVYKNAEAKDGWLMLATDLKVGERVRLVAEHATTIEEVAEVRGDAFRTVTPPADGRVFVYGREVPDFHSVDYDAIAMLNVSATQQIKREKDAEIQALREENSALRAKLAAQQDSTVSLEARLIAIEHRLSGESPAPQTVSVRTANAAK